QIVDQQWREGTELVRRTGSRQEFSSFFAFAFFALARWQIRFPEGPPPAPETTFANLQSALSTYENVRTGRAHAVYRTSKRERDAYFDLIDRWLTAALSVCPDPVARDELLDLTEPLPAVSPNGVVFWSAGQS